MVKLADSNCLPVVVVVALQTVGTQPPPVLILMARCATRGNAQKCPIQILDLDARALVCRHVVRRMASLAGQPRMFALEEISRFLVVEGLDVPSHQGKIFAIMFGVAADALLTRPGLDVVESVQAFSLRDTRADFAMTGDATEGRLAGGNFVARSAIRGPIQCLMCPGKRSRGNLRKDWSAYPQKSQERESGDPPFPGESQIYREESLHNDDDFQPPAGERIWQRRELLG